MNILAIGDIYGSCGLDMLSRRLPSIKRQYEADFCIVNGENAAGLGITPAMAESIFNAGGDVVTLGNHTFNRREIADYLDDCRYIVRPLNYAPDAPGKGYVIYPVGGAQVCVINLIGRAGMDYNVDNPFTVIDRLLGSDEIKDKIIVVDFHAETTSEKYAMAYLLQDRVSVLFGTHTHVLTADARLFGMTGYISDIGMTGPYNSIIGAKPESALARFMGKLPSKLEAASGKAQLNGVCFTLDGKNCTAVTPISVID